MATYKVLQDIESEDKLFGPFTLKQFIFGAITIVLGFIEFRLLISGAPIFITLPFSLVIFPFLLVFGFLAAPLGRDQPNDIWLLARLRFMFKPRRRIWNQDGLSELVTITAPKKEVHVYTNNFTQSEVRSRLNALASTLDSRGWAVKNINTNLFAQPGYLTDSTDSDRLIAPAELPQEVSPVEVLASDDILDPANNSTAQHLDQLVQQSTAAHKQQAIQKMTTPAKAQPASAQDYWFLNQPKTPQMPLPQDYTTFTAQQVVTPGTQDATPAVQATAEEEALAQKLAAEQKRTSSHTSDHMKVLQPLHDREGNIIQRPQPMPQVAVAPSIPAQPVSQPQPQPNNRRQDSVNPAILELAHNDDLNIATIARQAERMNQKDDGEVVISLH